ncbi:MAG TPA: type I glyceraldehyde-3-phosphate dehydrogenase [Nitrososphaeraceae archaeon]|nr:type I glyceraldehyde-3-phosphate dehydrogenase [Nitrososphaeraceae archaeon]
MVAKIAINGFGRIGRCFLRAAMADKEFDKIANIVAINDLTDSKTLAHLFKYDSTFGRYQGTVEAKEDEIIVDGNGLKVLAEKDPSKLPWKDLKIDIVIESTGKFNDAEEAKKHISAGAKKVIISAPAKSPDATVLIGINDNIYDNTKHDVISMASCTTNCLAPVLKTINEKFGIEKGYMTTCHAYTNDQRILDLPHKDLRRARAAMMSIIPTSTGAAKAIGVVIPELNGKMDGMALRVPVSNGSIVDVVLTLQKEVTREEINQVLKESSDTDLKGIMAYTEEPLVSSDIIGESPSSIVDGLSTMVLGKKSNLVKILSWYDNEWSFACRLIDLVKFISKKM